MTSMRATPNTWQPVGPTQTGARTVSEVFVGVDTHKDTHHVAVITLDGHHLTDREFPATSTGYRAISNWVKRWQVNTFGVEQTGTYGAGLTRHLTTTGHRVVEVNHPDPTTRARQGKSDPLDAYAAAQAARTGRAATTPKSTTGVIEAIRILHTTRRSAVTTRAKLLTQIGALAITAPDQLRESLGTTNRQIVATATRLRPDLARLSEPAQATKLALRDIARRVVQLDTHIKELDTALKGLVDQTAPRLRARPNVGVITAAQLLITAGQNTIRHGTDAQFARQCGIAPIPASSGRTHRHRLHRGGDRQANRAIHLVAIGRLSHHQPAITYRDRKTAEGFSRNDAIRSMKRLITRELFGALKADLKALDDL